MENQIEKQVELNASTSKVWEALTNHQQFGKWFRVNLEGPFQVGRTTQGYMTYPGYEHLRFEAHVEKMEPERLFSFTWPHVDLDTGRMFSEDSITLVEFKLKPTPNGTFLTITESGFENLPLERRMEAVQGNSNGWDAQIESIKKHLSPQIQAATDFLKLAANGKVSQAYESFVAPEFIHHNQFFKGDRLSLLKAMEEADKMSPHKQLDIKKVYEDGDTVITHSHVKQKPDDTGVAVVHIFRFENCLITELWDIGQKIEKDSINENGVF